MDPIFSVILWIFVIGAIGTGIGFWAWFAFAKPQRIIWKAKVYQLGDGIQKPIMHKGEIVANYRLSDLRPYTQDVAIQKKGKGGSEMYILKKLGKALPTVTADCVEVWGPKSKWIHVLLHEGTCTILKFGYDRKIGQKIFTPMPHDRITMIKTEMTVRKDKIEEKQDALKTMTTWIVVGFWCITLISVTYFLVNGYVQMSENNLEAARLNSEAQIKASQIYRDVYVDTKFPGEDVKKEDPPDVKDT